MQCSVFIPGKKPSILLFLSLSLSRVTVQRRQQDIAQQLEFAMLKEETVFALAVDESTDITDSAQLLIFIRSLSSAFVLCEDLLSMETLSTRTRGENIFLAVKQSCTRSGVNLKKPARNMHRRCSSHGWETTWIRGEICRLREKRA